MLVQAIGFTNVPLPNCDVAPNAHPLTPLPAYAMLSMRIASRRRGAACEANKPVGQSERRCVTLKTAPQNTASYPKAFRDAEQARRRMGLDVTLSASRMAR